MSLNIYVPRDERFGHLKLSDFLAYALKSISQFLKPELESLFDSTPNEFDSLQDIPKLYEGGIKLLEGALKNIRDNIPRRCSRKFSPQMVKDSSNTQCPKWLKVSYLFPWHSHFWWQIQKLADLWFFKCFFFELNCFVSLTWSRRQVCMEDWWRICKRDAGWSKPCQHWSPQSILKHPFVLDSLFWMPNLFFFSSILSTFKWRINVFQC